MLQMSWTGMKCEKCGEAASWNINNDGNDKGILSCFECHHIEKPSNHMLDNYRKTNEAFDTGIYFLNVVALDV